MKSGRATLALIVACSVGHAQTWQQVPLRSPAQKTAGLAGGEGMQQIYGIAYAPSNPNIVYFVSDTSQTWKSTNGGDTWQMKHSGFRAFGGYSIVVDPNNENVVLAQGNAMVSHDIAGSAKGIYRTTNGGSSWSLVRPASIGRGPDLRGGINFAFASSSVVYAGSQGEGVLKSTDNGRTWAVMNFTETAGDTIYDVGVHPDDPLIVFLSSMTDNRLYRISGGGTSITSIGTGLPARPHSIAMCGNRNGNSNDDIIYAATGGSGVYKSTDSGATFTASNNGLSSALSAQATAMSIVARPTDPLRVYVVFKFGYVYWSGDGGATWQSPLSMDEMNADGWVSWNTELRGDYWGGEVSIHPHDSNIALVHGANGVMKKTTNGGVNWKYSSSGYSGGRMGDAISSSDARSISWDPARPGRFAFFLVDTGPYLSTDNGSVFRRLGIPRYRGAESTKAGALEPVPGSQLIVTAVGDWYTQSIVITREADAPAPRWQFVPATDDDYNLIAFNPQNTNVIYAGRHKSTDKGYNWTTLQRKVVAMYPRDGNIVYAVAASTSGTLIHKSTNGGTSWISPSPYPSIPQTREVRQIAVSPDDQDRLYIAVSGVGIYVIDRASLSLKNEANGLQRDGFGRVSTMFVAVDPNDSEIVYSGMWIYLGESNGIFRSSDKGNTWANITGSLGPDFTPWALNVSPHDSSIYVGSSFGTWKLGRNGVTDAGATDAGVTDAGVNVMDLEVAAKRVLSPISVDGVLSESVWALTDSISRTISGTNDNTATFQVLWDHDYLYVAYKVLDATLKNDSVNPWEDDSVELYLDPDYSRSTQYDTHDRHFIKGWNDSVLTTFEDATGVLHGTSNIAGGYTVELAIPKTNLGLVALSVNQTLGFDLQQNDDDTNGDVQAAKGWNSTTSKNFADTSSFGKLTLSAESAGGGSADSGTGGGSAGGGGGGGPGNAGGGGNPDRDPSPGCGCSGIEPGTVPWFVLAVWGLVRRRRLGLAAKVQAQPCAAGRADH